MIQNPYNKNKRHVIQRGDDMDFVFRNSVGEDKKFQNMTKNVLGTKDSWNLIKFSTKEDTYKDFTVVAPKKIKGFDNMAKKEKNW